MVSRWVNASPGEHRGKIQWLQHPRPTHRRTERDVFASSGCTTSVGNFDVAEDWCRVLVELALHGFISIGSDRGDVNQPDNAIIGSGSGDDGPAIRVADKDCRV